MASVFEPWYTSTCSVNTITGYDESGAQTVVSHAGVRCCIEDGNQLVRDPQTGDETVSSTRLYLPPEVADWFALNSEVTVRGRKSEVIDVKVETDFPDLAGITVVLK